MLAPDWTPITFENMGELKPGEVLFSTYRLPDHWTTVAVLDSRKVTQDQTMQGWWVISDKGARQLYGLGDDIIGGEGWVRVARVID